MKTLPLIDPNQIEIDGFDQDISDSKLRIIMVMPCCKTALINFKITNVYLTFE